MNKSLKQIIDESIVKMEAKKATLREDNSEQAMEFDRLTGAIAYAKTIRIRLEQRLVQVPNEIPTYETIAVMFGSLDKK